MKKYKILGVMCLLLSGYLLQAQKISGTVKDANGPLFGANVYTTDFNYGTTSDLDGNFEIELPISDQYDSLVFSFIGYEVQAVALGGKEAYKFDIILLPATLEEAVVREKKIDRSYLNPINVQKIDAEELCQAACCNLSESFEGNATVDVNFADAVTGAKKIKMLGIDGYYTQTLFENMPSVRGLGNAYGLLFVPGPFMSSISINKGSGSVVNGYESITGQINYEYKKPKDSERFYLNMFASRHGQFEMNTNASHRFNENLSTMVLAHGIIHKSTHDSNSDGFQDVPLNDRVVFMNRWNVSKGPVFRGRFDFSYTLDDRESGQLPRFFEESTLERLYSIETVTRKYDAIAKTGFLFQNNLQSIGIQYKYTHHEQDSWYGDNTFVGREDYANVNFIFQTVMNKPEESIKLGWSYTYDNIAEKTNQVDLQRTESVPGIFAEYTYQDNEKLAVLVGLRADMHNIHGFWLSPKAHFKYNIQEDFVVKISAGKGYRTANIIAENMGALASSRRYMVQDDLGYESAWNVGFGLFKEFNLGFQPASIAVDYYRTDFTDQVVVDWENPREVSFYDLEGKSYSNSFQVEAEVEAVENLDVKLAYKLDDVYTTYKDGLKRNPYIPLHKVLLTLNYETLNEKWRMDLTGKVNSFSRIPSTAANPIEYERGTKSPLVFGLNSQLTYVLNKWDFYIGGENITSFWQENPIIAAENPFGEFFDASMIWGPLGGARVYAGFRFTLPYKEKNNVNN